jgi:hypothetical protein
MTKRQSIALIDADAADIAAICIAGIEQHIAFLAGTDPKAAKPCHC